MSIEADINIPDPQPHGHPVGVDVGLEYFLSTSDGEQVRRPRFFNELHGKLKSLQRRLKTKRKGSNNWLKLQKKVGRAHHRYPQGLAFQVGSPPLRQRGDDVYGGLRLPHHGQGNARQTHAGCGTRTIHEPDPAWVCFKRDVYFAKVDPRGTSQECPDCGAEVRKDLLTRIQHCHECGSIKPRDVAAGQVICTRGQRGIENACGVEVAGAGVTQSSQLALKQEIFGATQGTSLHTP